MELAARVVALERNGRGSGTSPCRRPRRGPITNIFIARLLSGLARLLIVTGRDYAPRKAEEITEDTRLLPANRLPWQDLLPAHPSWGPLRPGHGVPWATDCRVAEIPLPRIQSGPTGPSGHARAGFRLNGRQSEHDRPPGTNKSPFCL